MRNLKRTQGIFGVILAVGLGATSAMGRTNDLDARSERFPDLGVAWELPPLDGLVARGSSGDQLRGQWRGSLDGVRCEISCRALPAEAFRFSEPDDVTRLMVENYRDPRRMGGDFRFDVRGQEFVHGRRYGYAGYASIVRAARIERDRTLDRETAHHVLIGVLLPEHGFCIDARFDAEPTDKATDLLLESFKRRFDYSGLTRNDQWSDEEVDATWLELAPPSAQGKKFKKPVRSEHYLIMTNSSSGRSFAKKMEANYKRIRKIYPFEEIDGRRLMPVYLFRTNQQYYEFCRNSIGWSIEQAKASKGHASGGYYATWYESPNDPVHIHEATHQIFQARLGLTGGGSWFQEGVAEYIETRENDRNNVARLVKNGDATSLREFMALPSLLYSSGVDSRTGSKAHDHYKQAALLIEFLRESRFGRDQFDTFFRKMGAVRRNDIDAIEATLRAVYGVGIDELEEEFVAYCKKR